ncbi:MAG TPA: hypothetical protein VHS54_04130 [Jatrophihabitans sp.]|jgi:hypothetical protein|nr:hypothetical protein [Jatrophihabitans sp.]
MLDDIQRVVTWPLRSVGLDPGRALANAQPSPDERHARRMEQWEYVRSRFREQASR